MKKRGRKSARTVALKEGVDAAAQHKPENREQLAPGHGWPDAHNDDVGHGEDAGAACREGAEQGEDAPLIGEIVGDLDAQGVERMRGHLRLDRRGRCGGDVKGPHFGDENGDEASVGKC